MSSILANTLSVPPSSSAYTRRRGRNALAGPSTIRVTRESMGLPSVSEEDRLMRMQAGEGISPQEMLNLFEQCDICDRYFLASFLPVHIRSSSCVPPSSLE
jgi:hypothetical protein